MVFAEDVSYKECTSEKDVSKGHFNAECIHEQQYFDICYKRSKYAERQESLLSEEPVRQQKASVDDKKRQYYQ